MGAAGVGAATFAERGSGSWEPPLTDWTLRVFAGARSPVRVALVLAVGFAAVAQVVRHTVGAPFEGPWWQDPFLWLDLLNGALFAYVPAALWFLRRGRLRDLRELRRVLRPGADYEALVTSALCASPRALAVAGLVGAALLGSLPVFDPAFWGGPPPPLLHPMMLFFILRMAINGWLGGHALVTEAVATRALRRIGAEQVRVDLFDLGPLAVFARAGTRSALAWVIVSSLISLFWLGPGAGSANGFIVIAILALVSVAVVSTLLAVRSNIRAAKRNALAALEARIRAGGEDLLAGHPAREGGASLADLVALQGTLERVREWPVNAPAVARAALVAALALGSWLGGALVEHVVNRWFG